MRGDLAGLPDLLLREVEMMKERLPVLACVLALALSLIGCGGGGTLPAAPSNLQAQATSVSSIVLAWTDNSDNENTFIIERSLTEDGGFAQIGATGANGTGYEDTGLMPGTSYYYRIKAKNSNGDSGYSNIAGATTPAAVAVPAAPTDLAAAATSSTAIHLSWTDNADNETGIKIERSTSSTGVFSQIGTAAADATSYDSTGLTPGTIYYLK